MMIWGLIVLFAVLLGALPAFLGFPGVIASAVAWVGLFVTVSMSMTRRRMRIFANWKPLHLAVIVALPVALMAGVYIVPGVLEL